MNSSVLQLNVEKELFKKFDINFALVILHST